MYLSYPLPPTINKAKDYSASIQNLCRANVIQKFGSHMQYHTVEPDLRDRPDEQLPV